MGLETPLAPDGASICQAEPPAFYRPRVCWGIGIYRAYLVRLPTVQYRSEPLRADRSSRFPPTQLVWRSITPALAVLGRAA